MTRVQKVELEVNGWRKDFEINHAERLLRKPDNGGWKLPADSPYTFDFYDGISIKRNTGKSTEAGAKRTDSESNQATEQD